jgi:hypothetical protein
MVKILLFQIMVLIIVWHHLMISNRMKIERQNLIPTAIYRYKCRFPKRPYKVILCVFAGRQDRMSILNKYVLTLLRYQLIDSYHVWNLTRQSSDETWLRSWFESLPPKFKSHVSLHQPRVKLYKSFYEYYMHYPSTYEPNTVFIKLDDDIVYLDLSMFESFVQYRYDHPELWLLSANVINNGVCAYYQQQNNSQFINCMEWRHSVV